MTDEEKAAFKKLQDELADFKTKLETLTPKDKPEGDEAPREFAAEITALKEKSPRLKTKRKPFLSKPTRSKR